jgi:mono/diheme cytochrome c family protein
MKRIIPVLMVGLLVLFTGLVGCEDTYSTAVKYGMRTDPLMIAAQPGDLGQDVYDPDRPGLLPVLKPQDVMVPANPMSAKGMELFETNKLRDPTLIPADFRQKAEEALTSLFGTPLDPKVEGLETAVREKLKLDDKELKEGSRLYRINCVHCHGVPGDGHGPTSRWISPHPRDFRQGLFKFMSVDQTVKSNRPPRREDLYHTLKNGIEGTGMPSFVLLKLEQLNAIVSYVIHLSIRGKAEFDFISDAFDYTFDKSANRFTVTAKEGLQPAGVAEAFKEYLNLNLTKWIESQDPKEAIQVAAYDWKYNKKDPKQPEAGEWKIWKDYQKDEDDAKKWLIRGAIAQALFNNEKPRLKEAADILEMRGDDPKATDCKQCHTDYGRQAKFKFDQWGTLVRPNNFTNGVFRGGRRPVDIYHRVHSGISGSGMTPFGKTLSTNSIWDMVDFVQALSYPAMRKKLGVQID